MEVLQTIMTWTELIMKVICAVIGAIAAIAVTVPKLISVIKQRKEAKTEAEKEAANLAIYNQLHELISTVETQYSSLDSALKQVGQSAGEFKKEKVLSEIREYCDENNYTFDKEAISQTIDNLVTFTTEVNKRNS